MTDENHALEQAKSQLEGIRAMLAAVDTDYDRLEELTDDSIGLEAEELTELLESADGCASRDDALERIQEHPLSVQVRSGWADLGSNLVPEEFEILLCTGGPAVRIVGDLDEHNQPSRAWLEYQDWGTPWTMYFEAGAGAALVEYASHFYFGD